MHNRHLRILLVEDNPADVRLILEMLRDAGVDNLDLQHVDSIHAAQSRLIAGYFAAILLDLWLPDSSGLHSLERMRTASPDVPIVVLTALEDEPMALRAVKAGAQDYLVKGQVNGLLLSRALSYAIERHQMLAALQSQALTDELTGLYNRRGFLPLAGQQLKLSRRMNTDLLLLYLDLDGLKTINDRCGHLEGDQALRDAAGLIRATFRESDIVARLGGDEFAVLAIGISEARAEFLTQRLHENIEAFNATNNRRYRLSLSVGVSRFDPASATSIDSLLAEADDTLYAHKRSKQWSQ